MGKAISRDLRLWMVRGVASGKSCREVAAQFEVAPSTAVRLQESYARTGSVEPAKQGRPAGSGKLAPYRAATLAQVEDQRDITMPALASWLEETHGVTVDPSNLSKFLLKAGYSYKKNAAGLGERTQ